MLPSSPLPSSASPPLLSPVSSPFPCHLPCLLSPAPTHLLSPVFSPPLSSLLPQVYIAKVDPTSSLGLTTDSVYSYSMNHIRRVLGGELPESQPSRCVSKGPSGITVTLKGQYLTRIIMV